MNHVECTTTIVKSNLRLRVILPDEPTLNNVGGITDSPNNNTTTTTNNNNSVLFKFKQKIRGQAGNDDTKGVEMIVELKYLSNFWKPLEMPLFNCEISFMLTWSANCFLIAGTVPYQEPRFRITVNKFRITRKIARITLCSSGNFIKAR